MEELDARWQHLVLIRIAHERTSIVSITQKVLFYWIDSCNSEQLQGKCEYHQSEARNIWEVLGSVGSG
jgi:hypothetical protein